MPNRLKDKVAIVTGAGSGMGKAIAEDYAKEGAKVILADINEDTLNEVHQEITEAGGQATISVTNIANENDIDAVIKLATDTYGSLDILVNNAGIMDNFTAVGNVSNDLYDKVIAVNLTGPFKAARSAINVMEKQKNGGVIVNNASVGGLFGARGGAVYTISKHGLVGLTKNIAATYGRFGKVRANAIAPGGVNTNIQSTITNVDPLGGQALQAAGEGPLGDPHQIAALAVFLGSDESSFLNGDIIKADGGWTV
ncbi:SDR family oxidoreductase [Ligilactobacillus acidipiscis]|jgi:Dehydrogenases with different specificities (related to short-chain alcohol dehydrogenases)|nr:SDR family oxidoreductase [Ligilactobacillus acidipiscis]MCI1924091.1 SDR family oxidoreductase [Ligilactobacillus acidipiscis]MCI1953436.1 SDR family oxidoreductase [Ligilactobacillus acidipiscis]